MKIVQANKFYFLKGGAERYFLDLSELLSARGHEVIPFSMSHPDNLDTEFAEYFPGRIDYDVRDGLGLGKALRTIYSREARRMMERLLEDEKPDLVHLHNIYHQLTPSILLALRRRRVPVVQTLHDYKLICPSYLMIAAGDPCERCKGGKFFMAALTRCHRKSFAASSVVALEAYVHRLLRSHEAVRLFLCPSEFIMKKFIQFGFPRERMLRIPYFIPLDRYQPEYEPGRYYLYLGRLSREKGLSTLLDAAARARGVPLKIAGDGPLRGELLRRIELEKLDWVSYVGFSSGDELRELVRGATFTVVPSEWYENYPFSILESFALGKPVLGSAIGGIPELVVEGETGYLFPVRDAGRLAERIALLYSERSRTKQMGVRARAFVEAELNPDRHLDLLSEAYARAA